MSTALELRTRPTATTEGPSLVEAAYRALKAAIRDNVYPPGHHAAEPEIALQLGMSRTPVHEAIIRLQEDGLVQPERQYSTTSSVLGISDSRSSTRS